MNIYNFLGFFLRQKKTKHQKITHLKKILVINLQGMGDVLMTTPIIHSLAKHATIDVLVFGKLKSIILKENKDVNKTILFQGLKTIKTINKKSYDLIFLAHGAGLKSGIFFKFLKAKHKASHHYTLGGWKTAFGADIVLPLSPKMHRIDENKKLLQELNFPLEKQKYQYTIPTKSKQQIEEFIQKNNLTHKKIICIHPGGDKNNPQKRFSLKEYVRLSNSLPEIYEIIFLLGPDEIELQEKLKKLISKNNQQIFTDNIQNTAALIARSELLIHSDSGLGHLAAAVGTPTRTIVGPTNWYRTRPYGPKDVLIKSKYCPEPKEEYMEKGFIRKKNYFPKKINSEDILLN